MKDKSLKSLAINIKWKSYVLVSDRVLYFNETYKNWCIKTEREYDENLWREIFKAIVIPDISTPERFFTWYSQAIWWDWYINKTSAMENAETSSVWRALAMMWIWVIDSIASNDEINKANNQEKWLSKSDKLLQDITEAKDIETLLELQKSIEKICVSDKQKMFFNNKAREKYKSIGSEHWENLAKSPDWDINWPNK